MPTVDILIFFSTYLTYLHVSYYPHNTRDT